MALYLLIIPLVFPVLLSRKSSINPTMIELICFLIVLFCDLAIRFIGNSNDNGKGLEVLIADFVTFFASYIYLTFKKNRKLHSSLIFITAIIIPRIIFSCINSTNEHSISISYYLPLFYDIIKHFWGIVGLLITIAILSAPFVLRKISKSP